MNDPIFKIGDLVVVNNLLGERKHLVNAVGRVIYYDSNITEQHWIYTVQIKDDRLVAFEPDRLVAFEPGIELVLIPQLLLFE